MSVIARVISALVACWNVAAPMSAHAAEPLNCPEGTALKSRENARKEFAEWCVDASGKRHGPQREFRADGRLAAEGINDSATGRAEVKIYDESGTLTDELRFEGRNIVRRRMTLAGLENFVAELNRERELKPEGHTASFHVIDERTVGLDFQFADANPQDEAGAQKLRFFETYVRRKFCNLLTGPEEIHAIRIRVMNGGAVTAMTALVSREECTAQVSE